MRVEPAVSLLTVRAELSEAAGVIRERGWSIDQAHLETELRFRASIASPVDGEVYCFEFSCNDYPALPPMIEPVDVRTSQRGVPTAFPQSSDSFFHSQPVICIQFNRKAYKAYDGPHADWVIEQWQTLLPGVASLGDMLGVLALRVTDPEKYKGRRTA